MKIWTPKTLPSLVVRMEAFDAWLVGSAANPQLEKVPRDFDVFIPFSRWTEASPQIVSVTGLLSITPTVYGGWKVCYKDKYHGHVVVDIWPDTLEHIMLGPCKHAVHLLTKIQVHKR